MSPITDPQFSIQPIGIVHSPLKTLEDCPKQGREGAPDAWIEIYDSFTEGLYTLSAGQEILILTWLHLAKREILKIHPRANPENPLKGVFAMRSPHRPNPVGLHKVRILEITPSGHLRVTPLEVVDGTPVIDIKSAQEDRRQSDR